MGGSYDSSRARQKGQSASCDPFQMTPKVSISGEVNDRSWFKLRYREKLHFRNKNSPVTFLKQISCLGIKC